MAPLSAAPAFHLMLTSHLTPSDFLRRSKGCVRPSATAGSTSPRRFLRGTCGTLMGRQAEERREAVQLEQLCGELAHDVDILCAYPVPYTNDDQALTRICAEHTAVSVS